MGEKRRTRLQSYNLITGEDTYASQTAQNPVTSRRVSSFIPSSAGDLVRQRPFPKYLNSSLGAAVVWVHQFDKKDSVGTFTAHFFAATASALYKQSGAVWVQVTEVGVLTKAPQAVNINNLMHFTDGAANWIFDGTNWIAEGITIPLVAPAISQDFHLPLASVGTNWTNPNNVLISDGSHAGYNNTGKDDLRITDFNFFPPSGETPLGFTVIVRGHGTESIADRRQIDIGLTKDGTALAGTRKIAEQLAENVDGTITVGGETDLFGTTWADTDVTPSTFGILIRDTNAIAHQINIESVEVQIHFRTGSLTVTINRFYWTTDADETAAVPERFHESSSSPKSQGTGVLTNRKVRVYQQPGAITTSSGTKTLTGKGTSFGSQHVGMQVYIDGVDFGLIDTVTDFTNATLITNAPSTKTDVHFTMLPPRCTHWHIYASEQETSGVGFKLTSVLAATNFYDDESPFVSGAGTLFTNLERPIRNDPAPLSDILTVHKSRIWRKRNTFPNFFNFSAQSEIPDANGSPEESVPGTDSTNTRSDIVNETQFPDESDIIKNMVSHGDALYIFTEDEGMPLYGDDVADFGISQITAFKRGCAGRVAAASTPYGLAYMEYDKEILLYPTQSIPPPGIDFSENLLEIGRPQERKLRAIEPTDLDGIYVVYWPRRRWLVISYQDNTAVYHTLIYDFEIRAWWEMSQGFVSIGKFEVTPGDKILVAGSTDGNVYVIDDPNKTYSIAGLLYPESSYRPALLDFSKFGESSQGAHIFRYFEYEIDDEDVEVIVSYWLDPIDVDSPGDANGELSMTRVANSSNRFRGFPKGGGYCNRLLVEIKIESTQGAAKLRGINVVADSASNLAR